MAELLFVENHPHFSKVVAREFLGGFNVTVVPSVEATKFAVESAQFDIALVDYDLDDGKGDEAIRFIRENVASLPIIACSSHEAGNQKLLAAGANAICSKMEFSKIALVVEGLLGGM